jgi:hypothetical protein
LRSSRSQAAGREGRSPPASPTKGKIEQRRERILDIARECFLARGSGEPRAYLIRFGRASLKYLLSPDVLATRRLAPAEAERCPQPGRASSTRDQAHGAGISDAWRPFRGRRHFLDLTVFGIYERGQLGMGDELTPEQTDNYLQLAVDAFLRAYAS